MEKTLNIGLILPNINENYDVEKVHNANSKRIDAVVGDVDTMKEAVGESDLSAAIVKAFQLGNKHKQTLVSNLIALNVEADTSESWDSLLSKLLTISSGSSGASVGSIDIKLNCGDVYTIPEGYHDGTGTVSVYSLASQTQGTAVATNIIAGKTAFVNGNKVIGTIPDKAGATVAASTVEESGDNLLISIPNSGFYNTLSKLSIPKASLSRFF